MEIQIKIHRTNNNPLNPKSKLHYLIMQYKHYKDLAESVDGDDNLISIADFYNRKKEEYQYSAYNYICTLGCYRFLESIDM